MGLLPEDKTVTFTKAGIEPNKTYKMHVEDEMIYGHTESDLEAIKQAVYKIINTERYEYLIYSDNYGIELKDLFGMPTYYVIPIIPERIKDALLWDDRIVDVTDFEVNDKGRGRIDTAFTVNTIYGDFEVNKAVNI